MSHITIIISKSASPVAEAHESSPGVSYEYCIPVPHDATPRQVGKMVERAYHHLGEALVTGKTDPEKVE